MAATRLALVSVHDKTGIEKFAGVLSKLGFRIISTGGTAKKLKTAGIKITEVSELTGFPELMDGRVKTLHPKVHAAILADRKNPKHMAELKRQGIEPIDLVCVNLYPFEKTVSGKHKLEEAIEEIDIGGPTLLRAAAKNYAGVVAVTDPSDYETVAAELAKGQLSEVTKIKLAVKVWDHIAYYDSVISGYFRMRFGAEEFPNTLTMGFRKTQDLRYGENPHQKAAFYSDVPDVNRFAQLQGKQLSYNNILDFNAALSVVSEFDEPTAVIVKHNNPSGVASHESILEAYKLARAVDPEAAFGGIVGLNRKVDSGLAREITSRFVEIVIAPGYDDDAIKAFETKKNIRVIKTDTGNRKMSGVEYRSVWNGLLIQETDAKLLDKTEVVSKRKPTDSEMRALMYAWKVCKYVKSNAIVYAKDNRVIGIGAGQMKRIDAEKLAAMIAKDYSGEESLRGCAMASDAFFPFADGIEYAATLGVTAVIQPGGSIKDKDVIDAADKHGMAMVFTGTRHFRH